MTRSVSYTEARAHFADVLDAAVDDLEEVEITRTGRDSAVVVSLREYRSLKETAHLLGIPANARHLARSIAQLRAGEAQPHELIDVDDNAEPDS